VRPSEFSVELLEIRSLPPKIDRSWSCALVQSVHSSRYRRDWFSESVLPLALASAVRVSRGRRVRPGLGDRINPLSEFDSPSAFCPVRPEPARPQPTGNLSWTCAPFSTCEHRRFHARAIRAAQLRLQGLATLGAVFTRRCRAGLVSCRQRSWDFPFEAFSSPGVVSAFPRRADPHAVSLSGISLRRSAGPARDSRSFWASTPGRVPREALGG